MESSVKVAVSGKGGVGKTTLSAMLAAALSLDGRSVIAVDADPDANLAAALGISPDEQITPLSEMHQFIQERTGSQEGYGGYFKLNPRVEDIPEQFARQIGRIRLLVLGGVKAGGEGCICPASALLKALLVHLILGREECLVMDMEAGIEHLGRATAGSMDAMLVVVDAGPWSAQTAVRVRKLAGDLGMKNIFAVGNRLSDESDAATIRDQLGDVPLLGQLPFDRRLTGPVVRRGAGGGIEPSDALKDHLAAVRKILSEVEKRI